MDATMWIHHFEELLDFNHYGTQFIWYTIQLNKKLQQFQRLKTWKREAAYLQNMTILAISMDV